jgi:hypothetical protein
MSAAAATGDVATAEAGAAAQDGATRWSTATGVDLCGDEDTRPPPSRQFF